MLKVNESKRAFISLKSNPENYARSIIQAQQKTTVVTRDSYSHRSLIEKGFKEGKNLYVVSSVDDAISLFKKGKVDLIFTDPKVIKNHYLALNKVSEQIVDITIVNEDQRDVFIALNKQSDKKLIKTVSMAAQKVVQFTSYKDILRNAID